MYGLCLPPGRLCHPRRRAPGRRREQNLRALRLKAADNRIDGRRFAGAGTAGNYEQARLHSREHSAPLGLIEHESGLLLFEQGELFLRARMPRCLPDIQLF